jgi:hypothetical protein
MHIHIHTTQTCGKMNAASIHMHNTYIRTIHTCINIPTSGETQVYAGVVMVEVSVIEVGIPRVWRCERAPHRHSTQAEARCCELCCARMSCDLQDISVVFPPVICVCVCACVS